MGKPLSDYYYYYYYHYYYYYFYSYTRKSLTESLLNWKTSTGPNSAQLPFLYVITQTLETVNVDLELDYLHLFKKIVTLSLYNLHDGYKFNIMYQIFVNFEQVLIHCANVVED